ncbi:hypothetical protein [Streptomyces liliifuscus]|uniref:Uncharacterized protein n=1 Tax=Streptomyces liliifuscus TaxID=2797636 RepID=A0A7T7RG07_9ACTN|nr:hypothetical protein [Streptomyces liliifuscus]QQM45239.1 hypothetical protein JEQ17_41410 [Streptomyces liliifuscus]
MIRRLLRTVGLVARTAFRRSARGGSLPSYRPHPGEHLVILSTGRRFVDPDEAEALGMSAATVERMRRQQGRPEGRFPPGFIDRINQGRQP